MRKSVVTCLSALLFAACSDPQCREGEIRIGNTCDEIEEEDRERDAASPPVPERDAAAPVPEGQLGKDEAVDAAQQGSSNAEVEPIDARAPSSTDASVQDDARSADACVPVGETCDDADNDCDGDVDEGDVCKPECVPAKEVCNQRDDDCDGKIDEDPPTWYPDCDLDGVASIENALTVCTKPSPADCTRWTDERPAVGDCNDRDKRYSPNIPAKLAGTSLELVGPSSYSGDMDCDGNVETFWEQDNYDGTWRAPDSDVAAMPACPEASSACSEQLAATCLNNVDDPGKPVGCGITRAEVFGTSDSCIYGELTLRVVCW
jgi:hypothetical protein